MFKLNNGEIIKLMNLEYKITCKGCGAIGSGATAAEGIDVSYLIDKASFDKFKLNNIQKVRIYTSKGYFEKDIKDKFAKTFNDSFLLF